MCVHAQQEEVARAREAFMLRRWASILAQVKVAGGVEGVAELADGGNGGGLGWREEDVVLVGWLVGRFDC